MRVALSGPGTIGVAVLCVAALTGCPSSNSGSARDGGAGAAGSAASAGTGGAAGAGGASGTAGAAGALGECPTRYDLPHYDGGTSGLCDPAESNWCSCPMGAAAVFGSNCSPDGTACGCLAAECTWYFPATECGWGSRPAACKALADAVDCSGAAKYGGVPCASDKDCADGRSCNVRVANRMFCEGAVFARAADYCTDAGADAGDGAAGDAGAGPDAGDGG